MCVGNVDEVLMRYCKLYNEINATVDLCDNFRPIWEKLVIFRKIFEISKFRFHF